MKYTMAGIILFTRNYQECVDFYGQKLGLKILHRIDRVGERLTTFLLGDAYLMVEPVDPAQTDAALKVMPATKLRFNVPDVLAACKELRGKGIEVTTYDHSWGTTAEFRDPGGNLCALRSDQGFGD